jgi:hypothetical protein
MEFGAIQVLILGGTAAVLVPALIHLFNRTRYQVVDWAAMEFLLAALRKTRRRVRLENLLLLLLRILVLFFLALMLSRPSVEGNVPLPKQTHLVIVLDDSYSMGVDDASGSRFERARNAIEGQIVSAEMSDSDALSLIRVSETLRDYARGDVADVAAEGDATEPAGADEPAAPVDTAQLEALRTQLGTLREQEAGARQDVRAAESAVNESPSESARTALANSRARLAEISAQLTDTQAAIRDLDPTLAGPDAAADEADLDAATLLTTDRDAIIRKLKTTGTVAREPDWVTTFRLVRAALDQGADRYDLRRVVVLTDMQARNFPEPDDPAHAGFAELLGEVATSVDGNLQFVDVGGNAQNHAILSARALDRVVGVGVPIMLEVTVANLSYPRGSGTAGQNKIDVRYSIDDGLPRALATANDVEPGETATLTPTLPPLNTPGTYAIELLLDDSDELTIDNRYRLIVDVREAINVLAVDGQPPVGEGDERDIAQSELFFFRAALHDIAAAVSESGDRAEFRPKTRILIRDVEVPQLTGIDFFEFDLVVLANVRELDEERVVALERYVRAGGSLLITLGDNVPYDSTGFYNERLHRNGRGLLPVRLDRPVRVPSAVKMAPVQPLHRSIEYLAEAGQSGATDYLSLADYYGFLRVEWPSAPPPGLRRIVDLTLSAADVATGGDDDGGDAGAPPLMLNSAFGRGQVMVYTSSLDGRWSSPTDDGGSVGAGGNTLIVTRTYPAFWQEVVYALADVSTEFKQLKVGQTYRRPITPQEFSDNNYIFPPDANPADLSEGTRVPVRNRIRAGDEATFRGELAYSDTDLPGAYTVRLLKQRDAMFSLIQRVVDAEPGLTPIARRNLAQRLADRLVEAGQIDDAARRSVVLDVTSDDAFGLAPDRRRALTELVLQAAAPLLGSAERRSVSDKFAVNPETAESDMLRLAPTAEEQAAKLAEFYPDVTLAVVDGTAGASRADGESLGESLAPRKSQIWRLVGFVLLAFLVLEMTAALVFSRRQAGS